MRFISRRTEYRLVIKPTDRVVDDQRRVTIIRGKKAEFKNHEFNTEDPELIEAMLNHYACTSKGGNAFAPADDITAWRKKQTELTDGPLSVETKVGTAVDRMATEMPAKVSVVEVDQPLRPQSTVMVSSELLSVIDEKIASAMGKILDVITAKKEFTPRKKGFTCPTCNEVFKSGVDCGKHKKIAHPELYQPKDAA